MAERAAPGLHDFVATLLPRRSAAHLDIGCGDGDFLRNRSRAKEQYGLDREVPGKDQRIGFTQADLDRTDIGELFSKGKFDLITCMEVIEHIYSPYHLLEQVHGLLRKGGTVVFTTPYLDIQSSIAHLFTRRFINFFDRDIREGGHIHPIYVPAFIHVARKIGFRKISTHFFRRLTTTNVAIKMVK